MDHGHQPGLTHRPNVALASTGIWEAAGGHLQQKNTKAEDVHLGRLLQWSVGLGSSIDRVAGGYRCQLAKEVDGSVIGDFSSPTIARSCLKEDVGTADVSVDDGIWFDQVEVVEGVGYVQADGGDLGRRQAAGIPGSLLHQSSNARRQQLCQYD